MWEDKYNADDCILKSNISVAATKQLKVKNPPECSEWHYKGTRPTAESIEPSEKSNNCSEMHCPGCLILMKLDLHKEGLSSKSAEWGGLGKANGGCTPLKAVLLTIVGDWWWNPTTQFWQYFPKQRLTAISMHCESGLSITTLGRPGSLPVQLFYHTAPLQG